MHHARTLATTSSLLALALAGLTGCGTRSAEEPHSMSTTSVIDNAPTSGIRSHAPTAQPSAAQPTTSPSPAATQPSSQAEDDDATAEPSATGDEESETRATPSPSESEASCASTSATAAVDENIDKVPPPFDSSDPASSSDFGWVVDDDSTYDPCAALSWVTLGIEGTVSSPYTQMLFHDGEYLGTTTSKAIGFYPTTVRLDDSSMKVTYKYVEGNESNAEARGRATSVYTWNPDTESIDHSGEWPPGIG